MENLFSFITNEFDIVREKAILAHNNRELSNTFILSVSDGRKRAKTVTFIKNLCSISNDEFLAEIQLKLIACQKHFENSLKWAKLEWVTSASSLTWLAFRNELKNYKRNYYRSGIAFQGKREPWLLLTESELNANGCLYIGGDNPLAEVHQKNLEIYLRTRHGSSQIPQFNDELLLFKFSTAGVFFDAETQEVCVLNTQPRNHGRRDLGSLNEHNISALIQRITTFLGKQVTETGLYEYGYFPCFHRPIGTYNTLRHVSSTYALIEGYEHCLKANMSENELSTIKQQIQLALNYFETNIIRHYSNNLAYAVEINNEIKLGANAVGLLAITKYLQVFSEVDKHHYLNLAEKLANGIVAMQQENGSFVHILNAKNLEILAENRIIYYDGEAAFGLMRLYGMTKDKRWLECVEKAFDYFIKADHYKAHDHWLSYCSNELVKYKPERKYFEFAVQNVKGYVDFIRNRITTFPTLLELSMAFHQMLLKLDEYPEFYDVLDNFDVQDFYDALHTRANYLLNGVFFPEVAMYFKQPDQILYSCFIRHHAFRVRIDDVEHYLSGFVAYQHLLALKQYPKTLTIKQVKEGHKLENILTADNLLEASLANNGRWLVKPSENWFATGISIFTKRFKAGHIIIARGKNMDKGYFTPVSIKSLVLKGASAIITDDEETYLNYGVPVLKVNNVRASVLNIAEWIRKQYQGNVIGITGSAGKTTTVAMFAKAFSAIGKTEQSLDSANLPVGIAWNMSMMNQQARHWILEMAVGNMSENSRLAKPDIAVITNIAPAHLEYHKTVEIIAEKKARIFERMKPQSLAIICRDIEQYDILVEKARDKQLKICSYGEHSESDVRLISYSKGKSKIEVAGKTYQLKLEVVGKHMVLNAMAVIAAGYHLGYDVRTLIRELELFEAVDGRGNVKTLNFDGKNITLYDQAYNANPVSMKAALDAFSDVKALKKQKLLIIGDMLELGENSLQYHLGLVPQLQSLKVREIVLIGEMSFAVSQELSKQGIKTHYFVDTTQLKPNLGKLIKEGDHILIKASNGIGLHSIF